MEDRVWEETWCALQFDAPFLRRRHSLNLRDLALQTLAKFLQIEFRWQVFPATHLEVEMVDGTHGIKSRGLQGVRLGKHTRISDPAACEPRRMPVGLTRIPHVDQGMTILGPRPDWDHQRPDGSGWLGVLE